MVTPGGIVAVTVLRGVSSSLVLSMRVTTPVCVLEMLVMVSDSTGACEPLSEVSRSRVASSVAEDVGVMMRKLSFATALTALALTALASSVSVSGSGVGVGVGAVGEAFYVCGDECAFNKRSVFICIARGVAGDGSLIIFTRDVYCVRSRGGVAAV